MKISRRTLLRGIGLVALAGGLAGHQLTRRPAFRKTPYSNTKRSNIILFIADDMRYDVMGCAGNTVVKTPNLDALAAQSVYFDNAFVTSSICSVSRASIYTGDYALKHKVYDFRRAISGRSNYFFRGMRNRDYYTGFVGKWGVGGHVPQVHFNRWYGFGGQGDYTRPGSDLHLTDVQTRQAEDFLDHLPADRPFMLIVAYKAPHDPYITQKRFSGLYDQDFPLDKSDTVKAAASLPPILKKDAIQFLPYGHKYGITEHDYRPEAIANRHWKRKKYYELVTGVDDSVGQVLSKLEEKGLSDSTSVIFTSDNGMMLGSHGLWDKWYMFEESIRVPLIIKPASTIYPDIKPHRTDALALNIDIGPTILHMASMWGHHCQGMDLLPVMQQRTTQTREGFFYEYAGQIGHPSCMGYRTKKWKFVVYMAHGADSEVNECLYDLENDPGELHNLAGDPAHKETLDKMIAAMKKERAYLLRS